ncbi:MAG: T9SS type A sorting domain-containing protein [Bacteroidales bacterium]|nr:T9SS type A sorting domain-containing protein [Bacteroidales bacterium]MDD4603664.1 T9SS type A sorting domain-containing protein [Bacteroidales bacterium]
MKKLMLLLALALFVSAGYTQTSNIPNGDLESWYPVVIPGTTVNYEDLGTGPTDCWLTTMNALNAVPAPVGPGPVTVFKTTDKYSGTYAAKLVSANFVMDPYDVFIPGMLGTATLDMGGSRAILGRACEGCKPLKFKGFFKFEPVNGDSCAFVALVSKWNATTLKRDTVGYGRLFIYDTVATYDKFNVSLEYNYPTSNLVPDSMTLLIVSSGGFDVIKFMLSQGQVGSTLYVDELSLEYGVGMEQVLMPEVGVKLYPNPASETICVELSKQIENGLLEVYSANGKLVSTMNVSEQKSTLPVYSLANGSYFFKLKAGKHLLNSGTFIVKK